MPLTTEQMDQIVNNHFGYEATDDVEGVLSTLTDDARHEVIPSPVGELTDRNQQRAFYKMLFSDLKGEGVTPIRRLYGKDFLVDETIWHGRIENGRQFLLDGKSGPVSFRLLHIFELAGGKIKSEQVWCDLAAIQSQLGA
ncbi:MAG: nuclear transport factor 2 family protein [Aestuariivirga sp.]|nr:nuclear transport factor 2 family protein [Aestuariivirga sp.]